MSDRKKPARRYVVWLPVIAYMALVFMLSAQRTLPSMPSGILSWDKFQHYLAYMVMGLLIFRAAGRSPLLAASPYWQALIVGALYGASDEFHQSFVPGRNMSILDWTADVAGLLVALAVAYIYTQCRRR